MIGWDLIRVENDRVGNDRVGFNRVGNDRVGIDRVGIVRGLELNRSQLQQLNILAKTIKIRNPIVILLRFFFIF